MRQEALGSDRAGILVWIAVGLMLLGIMVSRRAATPVSNDAAFYASARRG